MKTKTTVRQRILNLLHKVGKPLDAKTIAKRGKLNYNTVRKELGTLLHESEIDCDRNFGRKFYVAYGVSFTSLRWINS